MGKTLLQFAFWLAYRVSRFVLLLSGVLIGISAVLPDFISARDGLHYECSLGSVSLVRRGRCCGTGREVVNLWFIFVPAAMCTAYFGVVSKLLAETPADGCCDDCGYNLTGNISGRCPECGSLVENV